MGCRPDSIRQPSQIRAESIRTASGLPSPAEGEQQEPGKAKGVAGAIGCLKQHGEPYHDGISADAEFFLSFFLLFQAKEDESKSIEV